MLWDKALRCGTVFSDRRLKSLFTNGLLPAARVQTRQFLSLSFRSDYHMVVRQAQAVDDSIQVERTPAATAPAIETSKETRFRRRPSKLSIETSCAYGERLCGEQASSEILALTHFYAPSHTRSLTFFSSFSSHQARLLLTSETTIAFNDPLTPSPALVYYTPPPTPGGPRIVSCTLDFKQCARSFWGPTEIGLYKYGKRIFKLGRWPVTVGHPGTEVASHSRRV